MSRAVNDPENDSADRLRSCYAPKDERDNETSLDGCSEK